MLVIGQVRVYIECTFPRVATGRFSIQPSWRYAMKKLMTILALAFLAGCSGMETSGGMDTVEDTNPSHFNEPTSPYFFGQG